MRAIEQRKQSKKLSLRAMTKWFGGVGYLLLLIKYSFWQVGMLVRGQKNRSLDVSSTSIRDCTHQQKEQLLRDLPNSVDCLKRGYQNKCSITQATKCPLSTWLHQFYYNNTSSEPFLAINVGCNKGFDAVQLLRMGSNNASVKTRDWGTGLKQAGSVTAADTFVAIGVCQQESVTDVPVSQSVPRQAQVHCLEPLPPTVGALRQANHHTKYQGLVIAHTAVSSRSGKVLFPTSRVAVGEHGEVQVGTENMGIDTCSKIAGKNCQSVPLTTLDAYTGRLQPDRVHVLLIDVEGWDYDVLLGGSRTLVRTEYIEFEYNWKGGWFQKRRKNSLQTAITYLQHMDFVCYWAGVGKLWRITQCWLDHFGGPFWSNVACVNTRLNSELANQMEALFLETLHG